MKVEETPMVSCIMPTYNRRVFVPYAIQYFLRQDYPQKELIIIDDGSDCIKDLVPLHPMINYYRLDKKISLGAKLNLACRFAKGSIIAHWDDDDWYASHRLSYQVCSLQEDGIYISGINHLFYLDLGKKSAFQYIYPPNQRPWLSGSSLIYKKHFWLQNNFANINVGMDGLFVWRTTREHLCVLPDSTFAVHIIHPENGSSKDITGSWWHDCPVAEIEGLLKEDWHTYSNENFYKPENKVAFEFVKEFTAIGFSKKKPAGSSLKNVFVCLVHENVECIFDLVRNLQYHDPSSMILLYNGSNDPGLLEMDSLFEKHNVFVYPDPHPAKHGYLHSFVLDCMQFALDNFDFDLMTIVDSDQLLIRENYSDYISNFFSKWPGVGLLSSNPQKISVPDRNKFVASEALKEYELWKPLLESFPDGLNKFVYWTFWPSTVFSASAIKDLLKLFNENKLLKKIMKETKIWATEEVAFPTLISLLGYEIALNPCSYNFVKYKKEFSIGEASEALNQTDAYWIHPVKREYNHPLRNYIRQHFNQYNNGLSNNSYIEKSTPKVCTASLLSAIKKIQGWLTDSEATLLISVAQKACVNLTPPHSIVEIGSYHGKSTVLFGTIIKTISPGGRIYAIDTHDGKLGAIDKGLQSFPPSFESFKKNLMKENLTDVVEVIKDHSKNVDLKIPISVLFIDGFHDYTSVANDFAHFSGNLREGGYVVFHDYADYFPGVKLFVDELLDGGMYRKFNKIDSLMVLEKV